MTNSDLERIEYTDFVDKLDVYLHKKRYSLAAQALQGEKILDLGCGYGFGTKQLAEIHPDKQFYAIDIDPDVIAYAKENNQLPNITYEIMSATALTFANESFDTVTSIENIEHIPDDVTYVSEAARVLKPGGVFFVTTPNLRRLRTRIKHFFLRNTLPVPQNMYHIREYSADELESRMQTHFSDIRLQGLFINIFPGRRNYLWFTNLERIYTLFVRTTNKYIGDYLVLHAIK